MFAAEPGFPFQVRGTGPIVRGNREERVDG
jgi:hypothetical protein